MTLQAAWSEFQTSCLGTEGPTADVTNIAGNGKINEKKALPASPATGSAWHPVPLARQQISRNKWERVLTRTVMTVDHQGDKCIKALLYDQLE